MGFQNDWRILHTDSPKKIKRVWYRCGKMSLFYQNCSVVRRKQAFLSQPLSDLPSSHSYKNLTKITLLDIRCQDSISFMAKTVKTLNMNLNELHLLLTGSLWATLLLCQKQGNPCTQQSVRGFNYQKLQANKSLYTSIWGAREWNGMEQVRGTEEEFQDENLWWGLACVSRWSFTVSYFSACPNVPPNFYKGFEALSRHQVQNHMFYSH